MFTSDQQTRLLRQVFGVRQLRPGQRDVIDAVLAGRDTLAIMPTGGGKSLCYQLPAMMLEGLTIVVSPLIALMKDQSDHLAARDLPVLALHSQLRTAEEAAALEALHRARHAIVLCTPEWLGTPAFLAELAGHRIAFAVIDEAHCIAKWGRDFRPAYLEIGAALEALGHPLLLALTATATDDVADEIRQQLGRPGMAVIHAGVYRPRLDYAVRQVTNAGERGEALYTLLQAEAGATIIYTATVKAAQEVHAMLCADGKSAALYHGKMRADERKVSQEFFMSGARRVMVATNAFGMGIDKPDIRAVIHWQVPASLDAYYQESGRAGRDGHEACATLLYLHADKHIQQFLMARHYPDGIQLRKVRDAVAAAGPGPVEVKALHAALSSITVTNLRLCLRLLCEAGLLRQDKRMAFRPEDAAASAAEYDTLAQRYMEKQEHDCAALDAMVAYAHSARCHWNLLLEHYGESPAKDWRCGHCDNCRGPEAGQT